MTGGIAATVPFDEWGDWALSTAPMPRSPGLTADRHRIVYLRLLYWAGWDDHDRAITTVSYRLLADATPCSTREVQTVLRNLQDAGLIVQLGGERGHPSIWHMPGPAPQEQP